VMTSPFRSGYRPDPPKKPGQKPDRSFSERLLPWLTLVDGDVDLRKHTTETDQYSAGSCVGNATADSVEVLNSIEGLPRVQLSRLFVYTLCRNLMDEDQDGRSDIDKDDGTFIRLAFDVLSKFGICREDLPINKGGWPYDLQKLHTLPTIKSMRSATGHRIHSYYRIFESGNDRLEKIVAALRGNHPVVFGTLVGQEFMDLRDEGLIGPPAKNVLGGHALLVVGYIQSKGFIIKNSWSKNWGDNGFCIMRPEYLSWDETSDIWVPTKGMPFR